MNESYILHYHINDGVLEKKALLKRIQVFIYAGLKFLFDRLLAIFGLIVASPIMLIIAIAIKLDSEGPVLFKQIRTGKGGKNFYIYKFRTMIQSNDVHDFSKQDQHTRVGKILRKTSLDELPQLYSIAVARMAFIGPRPWIPDYYESMNDEQRRRTAVRPGLTGLAQVMGRNGISIFKKINYDLEYINNYSLKQDLKIIFLTIKTVFTGSNADAGKNTIKIELSDLQEQNTKTKKKKKKTSK